MTLEAALETWDVHSRFDRFSARCRLTTDVIKQRDAIMSRYVAVESSNDQHVYICGAAMDRGSTSQECSSLFDGSIETTRTNFKLQLQKAGQSASTHRISNTMVIYWIPKQAVQRAASVLFVLSEYDEKTEKAIRTSATYRQLLEHTVRRQWLVTTNAVAHLPSPSYKPDANTDKTIAFHIKSAFPSTAFVIITPSTRLTFTTEKQEATHDLKATASAPTLRQKLGGLQTELQTLREMVLLPVRYPTFYQDYGIDLPKGMLLCGPPGVGKTQLVRTVVEQCQSIVPLHLSTINGSEILTSGIGDAENTLRDIFQQAAAHVNKTNGASVIFIDELDALCPKRSDARATDLTHSRIVAQLLTLLDGVETIARRKNVIVVGATNLPNAIDPALRRPGRFDRELSLSPPKTDARRQILDIHLTGVPFLQSQSSNERELRMTELSQKTIGYVGADLASLCREALAVATMRHFVAVSEHRELQNWWENWKKRGESLLTEPSLVTSVLNNAWRSNPVSIPLWFLRQQTTDSSMSKYFSFLLIDPAVRDDRGENMNVVESPAEPNEDTFEVTMDDFEQAMTVVVPSSLRSASGFSSNVEQVGWDAIGGQEETKLALQQALEWPIKYSQTFATLSVKPPRGILLYGPPGCSKSTVVRAAAGSSGATFLSLSAAQIFSPFFGEAEAAIRQVFRDARAALPAIIFFDEIDAMVTKREFASDSSGADQGSSTTSRILSTMLNEMDGVEAADGTSLLVIGATNQPHLIDAALLRPGRFDRILYVGLPNAEDRLRILEIHAQKMHLHQEVCLESLATQTPYFSGAELENVCREAALQALRESIDAKCVRHDHFKKAIQDITPVSSDESLLQYDLFAAQMGMLM